MKLRTVVIVYNPKGGTASIKRAEALKQELESRGIRVTLVATTAAPDSASELARAAYESKVDLVIVMGGDGTVRGVVQGLLGTGMPMAVYPSGTGNLFARGFFDAASPKAFADMLERGYPQPIDAISWSCVDIDGKPHSGLSIVAVGFGRLLDAIGDADPAWKKRFGKAVYVHNMLIAACSPDPVSTKITVGEQMREAKFAAALIMNVAPPEVPALSRGCNASDGLMDFVGLRGKHLGQLLGATVKLGLGSHEQSSKYFRWRVPALVAELERPMTINIDGDPGPVTERITLSVRPGAALMVLA
jgi:diacylglycerol kinase (ATP)